MMACWLACLMDVEDLFRGNKFAIMRVLTSSSARELLIFGGANKFETEMEMNNPILFLR